jgi:hypothetical protein
MWVTECNVTVNWTDEKTHEPSNEALRWQANRVAKVYAMSIYEGCVNTFYFIFGNYVERTTQYGVVHDDLTPRPAYVALAAVGRLLADAKPIGRWKYPDETVHGYLFRAKPNGKEKQVMVLWRSSDGNLDVKLNAPVEQFFDSLGRAKQGNWIGELTLTGAPVFAILPADAKLPIELTPPPAPPPLNRDKPADVVLQAVMPPDSIDLNRSAYILPPNEVHELTLRAYAFGNAAAASDVTAIAPQGWAVDLPKQIRVEPGGMTELKVKLTRRSPSPDQINTIQFHYGPAVLSIRAVDAKPKPPATQPH